MKYLVYILLMSTVLAQDLRMTNAFVKQNDSMKVASQSSAVMSVNFENKTNKREDVELIFFNSSYPLNTWSYKFSLAPKTHSSREFPFKLDANSREMKLQFKKGDRIINQITSKVFTNNIETILVIDDLLNTKYLKASFFKSSQRLVNTVATIPVTWVELKNVDILIINKPPQSQLTNESLKVISQYVNNGGSLLVTHPKTMAHIYDLGFGELLPAQFLSLVKKSDSRVMLKKSYTNLTSSQGFDFMKVKLLDGSHVMLRDSKDILVAAKPVGLGLSFFYALPLAQDALGKESNNIAEFMKFFISYSRRLVMPSDKGDSSLERYTSSMSGMVAPRSSGLFMILLIYGSCVFVIFLLARILKKVQYSWALVASVSVLFSFYLISGRDKMIKVPTESKQLQLSFSHDVKDGLTENVFSVYEIDAGKLNFDSAMGSTSLLNLSTFEKPKAAGNRVMSVVSSNEGQKTEVDIEGLSVNFLKISSDKQNISLGETEVEAETWRNFAQWKEGGVSQGKEPLELGINEQGLVLSSNELEGIFLGNNGVISASKDELSKEILEPLCEGLGRTQVAFCKSETVEAEAARLSLQPVVLIPKSKKIKVPSEFVGLFFTDFQNLWDINRNKLTKTSTGGMNRCGFRVQVPVELSGLKVKEIELHVKVDSTFPHKLILIDNKKRQNFTGSNLTYVMPTTKDVNELYFDLEIAFATGSGLQTVKEFTLKEFNISLKGELP